MDEVQQKVGIVQPAQLRASTLMPLFEHYASERHERGINVEAAQAANLLAEMCSRRNVDIALRAVAEWAPRYG